ncbi:hypothetical protein DXG03_002597 [Asterophora parasitica]|uniref:PNPLA domain-containing protein n=1 Tax=Asterophora parasitica TaxID=117018 RepID=A0A9P7KAX0_9AGAR|nr:hypothetical protein DXG03_002597 [Asterophora parasitica]
MSNKSSDESREGLRLLALDGGGIRGLSELVILGEIMDRIKATDNLPDTPRPCEYFDLIGGTSTGGLIAIMLGRLGMTVQEAIEAYTKFAGHVFTEKKWAVQDGTFKATRLQEAIQEIVEKHAGSENARMRDDPPLTRCKT